MISPILYLSTLFLLASATTFASPHRSGDVIINDLPQPSVQFSSFLPTPPPIVRDTQLHDFLTRIFNLPRHAPTHHSLEVDLHIDLFDRPTGHLLFSVAGLSPARLTRSDYRLFKTTPIVDLLSSSQPHNAYSVLASVVTGVHTNIHGVINRDWPRSANDDARTYEMRNVFDDLVDSGSRVVSAALSKDVLSVLSPRDTHAAFSGLYWSDDAFTPLSPTDDTSLAISKHDFSVLFDKLNTLTQPSHLRLANSPDDSTVTVTLTPTHGAPRDVVFDLSDASDAALFTELLFVFNVASSHKADSTVDFFSFHFTSLTSIYAQYGNSDEYDVAVSLIDCVVDYVRRVYGDDYATTVIYFPDVYATPQVTQIVEAVLRESVVGLTYPATRYYPHLYLSYESDELNPLDICGDIRRAFVGLEVEVVCDVDSYTNGDVRRSLTQVPQPSIHPTPTPTPAPAPNPSFNPPGYVTYMHIILWTTVFMFFATAFSCYKLSAIDGSNEPDFKPRNFDGGRSLPQKVQ